ncbi:MAG TPA: DUF6265 family protein [Vicinamibacteria bacterium]|jgi:hypothetical protein|nr:DUF6265 family protein [Vicinamibacteria bacterium]
MTIARPFRLVAAGLALLAPTVRADQEAAPPTSLADLAWIAGRWVDSSPGSLSEEVWTAPSGDSMMGMWRFVSDGRTRIFELLTITTGEGGLELRLRHFDPLLVAREDKERPVVLKLVRRGDREAAFEGREYAGTVRITYRRTEDGLAVTLEKGGTKEEFRFRPGDAHTP